MSSIQTNTTVKSGAKSGECEVLYMTPEKACSLTYKNVLSSSMIILNLEECKCSYIKSH